jgi:hypothetical protein
MSDAALDPPDDLPNLDFVRRFFTRFDSVAAALAAGVFADLTELSMGVVRTAADLDAEPIFGPKRDYVCACGRYSGRDHHGIICEDCHVELLPASARRGRIGHLELARPVIHPWYADDLALLLETSVDELAANESLADVLRAWFPPYRDPATVRGPRARARAALIEAFETADYPTPNSPSCLLLTQLPVPVNAAALGVPPDAMTAAYEAVLAASPETQPEAVRHLFATLQQPSDAAPASMTEATTDATTETAPGDLLWNVAWTLGPTVDEPTVEAFAARVRDDQERLTGSSRWWRPNAPALASPRVRITFHCSRGSREEEPVLDLRAPNGATFTHAELLFAIAQAIAAHLTSTGSEIHDHHFFEGLTLVRVDPEGPLYRVQLGS